MSIGTFLSNFIMLGIPLVLIFIQYRKVSKLEKYNAIIEKQNELYQDLIEMMEKTIKEHSKDESKCKNG